MSARRMIGWAVVVLLLVPWWRAPSDRAARGPMWRLVGPVAGLAASAEWVRFTSAVQAGQTERAYAIAERALELDPASTQGWLTLGRHFVFDRASVLSEPDAARRRGWIRAGLDVLRRGEERAENPGELALVQGTIHAAFLAELDPEILGWPGGRRALLETAIEDFERATAKGQRDGARFGAIARERLAALTGDLGDDGTMRED